MKKSIFILTLLACIAIGFTSCNTGGDDRPYSFGTATIVSGSLGAGFYIKLDGIFGTVIPTNMPSTTEGYIWKGGDRAFVQFYLNEEESESSYRSIELMYIELIPTLDPILIDRPEQDTLGTAPFYEISNAPNELWVVDSYLTANFAFFYHNITKHRFYLSCPDPTEIYKGADTIHLKLSHKTDDEYKTTPARSLLSFKLNNFISPSKDSVTLSVEMPIVTDPNETTPKTKVINLTYKWDK